ncbi:enoyl-CoA hydratase/isomerase family protein [Nocardia implantans]|uniref:Enoyl-CoA hydratase/isomerase family protein n=1 Tax=Nocardia implantans TaxID=3108168 RepID=A0ABU6ARL9_9NOCA|nr:MULTISPECIES: enoyl-CoA hydratase/isomerase family protein [unclassified Nocardia]MBF6191567.1 enoyl-CoA hydratase/isomerase family protein [Nocardia beijingensis]MEA3528126.1 enoyl-CoA hydratase/isomerase family protein [Nocardia sp. CDC192]MEB3510122.1 enoyl-CoA hydratase/isomerase family protein [Nocardia sp. CDC186]
MFRVIEVTAAPDAATDAAPHGVVVAVATGPIGPAAEHWLEHASFTLTEAHSDDPRVVTVAAVDGSVAALRERFERHPTAATICDDVLRAAQASDVRTGLLTESFAYSTLQGGPEFGAWLRERGPAAIPPEEAEPLEVVRTGHTLTIRFDRPHRHNAFDNRTRAALLDALAIARLDPSVLAVELCGNGPSFCSGGDLAEFGAFTDVAAAHLARTRHSPALALHEVTARLGRACRAVVHGRVLGSGVEMAAACGAVVADPGAEFGLPELDLGLIPGAGGTVSVTRRIGRWRTGYLVLSGRTIPASTALVWGLVDAIAPRGRTR